MSQSPSISLVDTIAASVKDDASIATINAYLVHEAIIISGQCA